MCPGVEVVALEQLLADALGRGQVSAVGQERRPQEQRIRILFGLLREISEQIESLRETLAPQEIQDQLQRRAGRRAAAGLGAAWRRRPGSGSVGERLDTV